MQLNRSTQLINRMRFKLSKRVSLYYKSFTKRYATTISLPPFSKIHDKDYLPRSFIPTDHFQKSLPHLPIPKLEDTCNRYLKSQKALSYDYKLYGSTEKYVRQFQMGEGQKLQKELQKIDENYPNTSYISSIWFNHYLKDRSPIALNNNPFISIKDDPRPGYNDQLVRATNLVISSLRFLKSYENNILAPDVYHLKPHISETQAYKWLCRLTPKQYAFYTSFMFSAFPLDMSQYRNLFCSTRVPRLGRDEIVNEPTGRPHIVVAVGANLYAVDVLENDGRIKPASLIYSMLYYMRQKGSSSAAPCSSPRYNVALFGAMCDRNQWATLRDDLIATNPLNYASLNTIDNALYVLCLDDPLPSPSTPTANAEGLARNFLLCPSGSDTLNRWFDKSFQLIVTPGGKVAVSMEHSWGDGVSVVRFLSEIWQDSTKRPAISPLEAEPRGIAVEKLIRPIEFKLSSDLEKKLDETRKKLVELNKTLQISATKYEGFGKSFIKSYNLSPDAILQLSFQMANYKLLGKVSPTYESCSTAAFKHGRTETIRPATLDTRTFCEAFLEKSFNLHPGAARDLLKCCSRTHSILTREAAMGQGFDRHLFALKTLAENEKADKNSEIPAIFTDPAYSRINHILLSTSTVESAAVEMGGFGPVVHEGLGISYGCEPDCLGVFATSYDDQGSIKGKNPLNSKDFIATVVQSLDQLKELLTSSPKDDKGFENTKLETHKS